MKSTNQDGNGALPGAEAEDPIQAFLVVKGFGSTAEVVLSPAQGKQSLLLSSLSDFLRCIVAQSISRMEHVDEVKKCTSQIDAMLHRCMQTSPRSPSGACLQRYSQSHRRLRKQTVRPSVTMLESSDSDITSPSNIVVLEPNAPMLPAPPAVARSKARPKTLSGRRVMTSLPDTRDLQQDVFELSPKEGSSRSSGNTGAWHVQPVEPPIQAMAFQSSLRRKLMDHRTAAMANLPEMAEGGCFSSDSEMSISSSGSDSET